MTSPTFGTVKQIEAGVLNVGYVETGPPKGPPVLLLHGWPYDVHSYAEVAPRLGSAGYRVIVPYLRGFGPTLFRSIDTIRNGQQSALGLDAIALMDALDVRHAIIGGFDWGARGQRHGRALAGPVQGHGVGERLSDREPGSRRNSACARGRVPMVVPVLFRHRAGPRRLRQVSPRVRAAHLAAGVAPVALRRRHLRGQRRRVRQSRSRRQRHPVARQNP